MALRALIEGDALISELLYMLTYFDEDQQAEAQSNRGSEDLTAFYAAPAFIQSAITFPYSEGYQFAVNLYLKSKRLQPHQPCLRDAARLHRADHSPRKVRRRRRAD